MRAGLLSDRSVIKLINENFVATWVLIDELKIHASRGNRFAVTLERNWEFPLDVMFLSSDGQFATKLNSFRDFPAHAEVSHPSHGDTIEGDSPTKTDVFLSRALRFLER